MKRTIFTAVLIVAVFFGMSAGRAYGQNADTSPIDLILVLDTSTGMSSSYENVSNYLTGEFLTEFLRVGDTFHLITFSGSPKLDSARRVSGIGDVETIVGRMLIQYPVETGSNVGTALSYTEQYVTTLPRRSKKIVLVTLAAQATGGLVTGTRQRLSSSNSTIDYVQITPGQRLTNLPASGRPDTRTASTTPAASPAAPTPPSAATTPPPATSTATPSATTPAVPSTSTATQTPATTRPAASSTVTTPPASTATQTTPSATTQPASSSSVTTPQASAATQTTPSATTQPASSSTAATPSTSAATQTTPSVTTQPTASSSVTTPSASAATQTTPSATTQPAASSSVTTPSTSAATQTPSSPSSASASAASSTSGITSPAAGSSASGETVSSSGAAETKTAPSGASSQTTAAKTTEKSKQTDSSFTSSLPFIIGIIILILLILGLIIFLLSRKLSSSPNRVMSSSGSASAPKEETSADHSKDHLAKYAAVQPRQRTTPYDNRPSKAEDKSVVINPSGPLLLNLFVNDQNTSIGKRNIHSLKSGYSLTVGGGKTDDYFIFLVPVPAKLGEIRRDGSQLTFIPHKPKYFPDIGSNHVKDCINKSIRIISDKNYEMRFRFEMYEDPLIALNRLLHSVKVPG